MPHSNTNLVYRWSAEVTFRDRTEHHTGICVSPFDKELTYHQIKDLALKEIAKRLGTASTEISEFQYFVTPAGVSL